MFSRFTVQELLTVFMVSAAVFFLLFRVARILWKSFIRDSLAKWLLKKGHITLAFRIRHGRPRRDTLTPYGTFRDR
ncbi:MAG: hypothetical protein A2428_04910 [Bdellovibrionales bacterium RIFOXYC1_FULL_54_43]|nr:MAG: hypothetical protein A2428_04910 [Bdellovibrionales bacterium RIFOXYC1_FULL_54_43]OFZ84743.1 MAG: hypothetical protein A2603_16065 [Bdellovibrionales bacterium RIFOXYD1_FULL_55_31]